MNSYASIIFFDWLGLFLDVTTLSDERPVNRGGGKPLAVSV
jgi:hypothetical protein